MADKAPAPGQINYARYEARRRNIIAMLRATLWQELLHRMELSGERFDPYEAALQLRNWTQSEVEEALDEGFLIKVSWEGDRPPTITEVRAGYFAAAEAIKQLQPEEE